MSIPKLNPPFTIPSIALNGHGRHWRWSAAMDHISYSAIAMAIGLLIVIWVFLMHMILSQAPDAHLRFLLDLMEEMEEQPGSSSPRRSSPSLPDDHGMKTRHVTARSAGDETKQYSVQHIRREVPLLFTTSLRGRGL